MLAQAPISVNIDRLTSTKFRGPFLALKYQRPTFDSDIRLELHIG